MLTSVLDLLVVILACTLNERMQKKLDYSQREVRVLMEVVAALTGKKRIPVLPGAGTAQKMPGAPLVQSARMSPTGVIQTRSSALDGCRFS